jgi:hypothetical protein
MRLITLKSKLLIKENLMDLNDDCRHREGTEEEAENRECEGEGLSQTI